MTQFIADHSIGPSLLCGTACFQVARPASPRHVPAKNMADIVACDAQCPKHASTQPTSCQVPLFI